jgi:hypothetical protein
VFLQHFLTPFALDINHYSKAFSVRVCGDRSLTGSAVFSLESFRLFSLGRDTFAFHFFCRDRLLTKPFGFIDRFYCPQRASHFRLTITLLHHAW